MLRPLGQNERRSAVCDGPQHVIDNEQCPIVVGDELRVDLLDSGICQALREAEVRGAHNDLMVERPRRCLLLGVDPNANWTALEGDDRVVTVLPHRRGSQTDDESRPCLGDNLLEVEGGNVVTLVYDDLPIVRDEVVHFSSAAQTLQESDINNPT